MINKIINFISQPFTLFFLHFQSYNFIIFSFSSFSSLACIHLMPVAEAELDGLDMHLKTLRIPIYLTAKDIICYLTLLVHKLFAMKFSKTSR